MDKAITYNEALLKVNRAIDMLRTCGMDVTEFERARDIIDEEVKGKVKASYDYNDPKIFAGSGQEAFLIQDYGKAESRLNRLYGTLEKYNVYIKAYSMTKVVKDFLSMKNKQVDDFEKYRSMLEKLLIELKHSGTLDYQIEEPIIKDIYHVVYLFIKEEYSVLGESSTISSLKDSGYLDYEIRRELENINLSDEKYTRVAGRKAQIDALGLNSSYVDSKLIRLLVDANTSIENKLASIRNLENRLQDYVYNLKELEEQLSLIEDEYENKDKFSLKYLASRIALLAVNLGVTVGVIIGAIHAGKALTNIKYYSNTTKVYVDNDEEPASVESNYLVNKENSTSMYNYYPSIGWVKYELADFTKDKLDDYMAMDMEASGIKGETISYYESRRIEASYENATRVIKNIQVDLEDTEDPSTFLRVLLIIFLVYCALKAEGYIYEMITYPNRYEHDEIAWWPVILEIGEIIEEIDLLSEDKSNKLKIEELTKKLTKLVRDNEDVVKKISELIPIMEEKPEFSTNVSELKKCLEEHDKIVKKRERSK